MADEMDFDEDVLFSEFEAVARRPSEFLPCQDKCTEIPSSMDVEALKEENCRLKQLLKRLLIPVTCNEAGTAKNPLFHAIFFNHRVSTQGRHRLEYFLQSLSSLKTDSVNGDEPPLEMTNLQPSVLQLNEFVSESVLNISKKDSEDFQNDSHFAVVNCCQYFEFYCIDACGFPLVGYTSGNNEDWEIPMYEQVFFTAIPCEDEGASKVRIRRKKACFNCGNVGHNLSDCPEPQNQARIDSQRQQFIKRFSSPFSKNSRYHIDEKRYSAFKPGLISDELRNALGIKSDELPPHIYKMRQLGYPPGYIPMVSKSTLVLYNADGNIEDYVMEDLDDEEDDEQPEKNALVEYPGFNCPLPEGVRDRSREYGFPPMSPHQSIPEMERWCAQMFGQAPTRTVKTTTKSNSKRSWNESNDGAGDMDLDEDQEPTTVELSSNAIDTGRKRKKHDLSDGGYSPTHPDIQYGIKEQLLLDKLHQSSSTNSQNLSSNTSKSANKPPLPCELTSEENKEDVNSQPSVKKTGIQRTRSSESLEEGEVISDDDEGKFLGDDKDADEKEVKMNQGWWLTVPLTSENPRSIPPNPPPVPSVKLPMDLLTRFYTTSTVLHSVSFEDRIMWLDPIYGNIQVSSGRYDKLREILQQKKVKKRRR